MTTDAVDGAAADAVPDRRVEAVVAAMRDDAESMKRREVEAAVDKLDALGGVTDDQREAVDAMADAIVDRLLAAPAEGLRDAAADGDRAAIDAAIRLFDPGLEEASGDE